MAGHEERTVTISGVKVIFPCKPYPSQFGMMDRVIKGLEKQQNCLLESPTGSGKSLALLCSALAWQVAHQAKITSESLVETTSDPDDCCKTCTCGANKSPNEYSPESKPSKSEQKVDPIPIDCDDDDDDDFKPVLFQRKTPKPELKGKKRKHVGIKYEDDTDSADVRDVKCTCSMNACSDSKPTMKKQKLPKIYFGTRTHKQIAQIVRELRKTAYHDSKMTILASREHTCIHPEVIVQKNKNEGCRERLDRMGPGCKFNDKSKRVFLSQGMIQDELPSAWDLEDLVGSCKRQKACPYFVTKNIREGADIIFCPYNYLIDPLVRKSMEINLKGQIVILDEAHNIEDSARDAASGSITTEQINAALLNLQQLLDANVKISEHLKLKKMLDNLLCMIEEQESSLDQQDYNTSFKIWSGFDIVARLRAIDLGPDRILDYQRSFESATQNDDDQISMRNNRNQELKLKSTSTQIMELLFQILDYMYRDDLKFVEDYRVAIMKTVQYVSNRETGDRWLGKNRRGGRQVTVLTLNFWCMNPAVAFSDFNQCRNVVLSSGTLSPMSSFQSELGVPFPIQLEANHIIEDKQVWVGAVGVGPSGHQLQAVYRNMETFQFQDELGQLILQVCLKVPNGVLCFLPSYRALQKFVERWKITGLWNKLICRKRVMIEPRAADKVDFDGMMKAFYEVVKGDVDSEYLILDECADDSSEIDGALFFAVCRGKVSEGMDFADNNARAVITVGIPFPSIKDVQVKLKKEYNDRYRASRGLLSGNDWYEIQAFRALNQALGRCIRHRKDWGALIIVDDRFVKNTAKYTKSLSRWVRSKVQTYDRFPIFIDSVSSFTDKMMAEMPTISADTSFIPCTPGDGRVGSRRSMDNMNTSLQTSPYFSSPPLSQSPQMSFNTPKLTNKRDSVENYSIFNSKGKGDHSPTLNQFNKGSNSPNMNPLITSLSVQEQINNVINSMGAPKDQPYYVVLNQGTPQEQAYLIQPNNPTTNNPVITSPPQLQPTHPRSILPKVVPSLQNNQILHQTGEPVTSIKHETGTSSLMHSGTESADRVQNEAGIQNKTGSGADVSKQADIVFNLGTSTLSFKEQLKQFISSGQAPTDRPYYVVTNKGLPTERAFFIDPNKKGKGQKDQVKQESAESASTSVPSSTVTSNASNPPSSTEVMTNSTGVDNYAPPVDSNPVTESSTEHNKFLKFCHMPKTTTSHNVPVATVTPQRPGTDTIKNENTEEVEQSEQNVADTEGRRRSRSPVLFDDPPTENVDNTANTDAETDIDKLCSKKKPIFKKRNSMVEVKNEPETDCVDNKPKIGLRNIRNVKNEAKDEKVEERTTDPKVSKELKDTDFEDDAKSQKKRKFVRGINDKVVVDKVKLGRHTESEKIDAGVLEEKNEPADNSMNSDEEFLNTRRRGGRKRKSTSKFAEWKKRTRKDSTEADGTENKENMDGRSIRCSVCETVWCRSTASIEKKKPIPDFLHKTFSKNMEMLLLDTNEVDMQTLSALTADSGVKGIELNSTFTDGCCIQYMKCKTCETGPVVGARVLLADSKSPYKAGQLWIVSSVVKS